LAEKLDGLKRQTSKLRNEIVDLEEKKEAVSSVHRNPSRFLRSKDEDAFGSRRREADFRSGLVSFGFRLVRRKQRSSLSKRIEVGRSRSWIASLLNGRGSGSFPPFLRLSFFREVES